MPWATAIIRKDGRGIVALRQLIITSCQRRLRRVIISTQHILYDRIYECMIMLRWVVFGVLGVGEMSSKAISQVRYGTDDI